MASSQIIRIKCQDGYVDTILDTALLRSDRIRKNYVLKSASGIDPQFFIDFPKQDVMTYLKALRELSNCGPSRSMKMIDIILEIDVQKRIDDQTKLSSMMDYFATQLMSATNNAVELKHPTEINDLRQLLPRAHVYETEFPNIWPFVIKSLGIKLQSLEKNPFMLRCDIQTAGADRAADPTFGKQGIRDQTLFLTQHEATLPNANVITFQFYRGVLTDWLTSIQARSCPGIVERHHELGEITHQINHGRPMAPSITIKNAGGFGTVASIPPAPIWLYSCDQAPHGLHCRCRQKNPNSSSLSWLFMST